MNEQHISTQNAVDKLQNMDTASINQMIADLEAQQAAYHSLITTTRSNINNTDFVTRAVDGHRKAIEFHQRMIHQYQHSVDNGPEIIADAQGKLKALKSTIVLLKHKKQVNQLLELQQQIESAQSSMNGTAAPTELKHE